MGQKPATPVKGLLRRTLVRFVNNVAFLKASFFTAKTQRHRE